MESERSRKDRLVKILSTLSHLNLTGQITGKEQHAAGIGSTCDVFVAYSQKHRRKVAVKQIRAFLLEDLAFANTLAREIRIWAALKHANVLPLWGFIAEGESAMPSLISEWMHKGTLFKFMKTFPKCSSTTCKLLQGIAEGLAYLHSEKVVHADLKSQNILISQNDEPLLTDFGLSLALMHSTTATNKSASTGKGSIRWMARELIDADFDGPPAKHDEKTDVWAFGMVVYEVITWEVPYWKFPSDTRVLLRILKGELPEKPLDLSSKIGGDLWILCKSCWTINTLRPSAKQIFDRLSETMTCDDGTSSDVPDRGNTSASHGTVDHLEDENEDDEEECATVHEDGSDYVSSRPYVNSLSMSFVPVNEQAPFTSGSSTRAHFPSDSVRNTYNLSQSQYSDEQDGRNQNHAPVMTSPEIHRQQRPNFDSGCYEFRLSEMHAETGDPPRLPRHQYNNKSAHDIIVTNDIRGPQIIPAPYLSQNYAYSEGYPNLHSSIPVIQQVSQLAPQSQIPNFAHHGNRANPSYGINGPQDSRSISSSVAAPSTSNTLNSSPTTTSPFVVCKCGEYHVDQRLIRCIACNFPFHMTCCLIQTNNPTSWKCGRCSSLRPQTLAESPNNVADASRAPTGISARSTSGRSKTAKKHEDFPARQYPTTSSSAAGTRNFDSNEWSREFRNSLEKSRDRHGREESLSSDSSESEDNNSDADEWPRDIQAKMENRGDTLSPRFPKESPPILPTNQDHLTLTDALSATKLSSEVSSAGGLRDSYSNPPTSSHETSDRSSQLAKARAKPQNLLVGSDRTSINRGGNLNPCGYCREKQIRCDVYPPYSKLLCRKCHELRFIQCPPATPRLY